MSMAIVMSPPGHAGGLLRPACPRAPPFGGALGKGFSHPQTDRRVSRGACTALTATPPLAQKGISHSHRPAKLYDMATLGNLCVDVFVDVDRQPSRDLDTQRALLASLLASPPDPASWEVGGATNVAIAASRLGLRVASSGPLGHDRFGDFLSSVLKEEHVSLLRTASPPTLVCHVLVDGQGNHSFCSAYDTGPWPMLGCAGADFDASALQQSRAVLFSGVVFDEAPEEAVLDAVRAARAAGAAVFFDPGPRAWTFQTPERASLLQRTLALSDVVLVTEYEALAIVRGNDYAAAHMASDCPQAALEAAHSILLPGGSSDGKLTYMKEEDGKQKRTELSASPTWCVVKRGERGALLATKSDDDTSSGTTINVLEAPAPRVSVVDTVGCGDAFAAAIVRGYLDRRHDTHAVLAMANAVGAATACRRGAGRNVARMDAVRALLLHQLADESHDSEQREAAQRALALMAVQAAV